MYMYLNLYTNILHVKLNMLRLSLHIFILIKLKQTLVHDYFLSILEGGKIRFVLYISHQMFIKTWCYNLFYNIFGTTQVDLLLAHFHRGSISVQIHVCNNMVKKFFLTTAEYWLSQYDNELMIDTKLNNNIIIVLQLHFSVLKKMV